MFVLRMVNDVDFKRLDLCFLFIYYMIPTGLLLMALEPTLGQPQEA